MREATATQLLTAALEPVSLGLERPRQHYAYCSFFMAQQAIVVQGLLTIEASRSHTLDTPHSVGLLWTSDQPDAETST
jgi:hypothetical protein